jgi:uncharacterized protein YecE (DUF72 family)
VSGKIRVGPAGWSYDDWRGIVYPARPGSKFDPLAYLADYFDTIEINSTFYHPPTEKTAKAWVRRIANNSLFRFTAKLYQRFTHERGQAGAEDEAAVRTGLDPIAEAGKLGALLLQFPWSFRNTEESREYLANLIDRFSDYPMVVELRHESWNRPAVYQSLERRGVGFCNIDQPLFKSSIRPSARTTSMVGYVRLHGRNYQNWFSESASVADRYDYLYSPDELDPWIDKIKTVGEDSKETYVITNNHYRGKAVVNALEIKAVLAGQKVEGPPTLIEEYPQAREVVAASGAQH